MIKNPLFAVMFSTLIIIAGLNKLALHFSLYWTIFWFDILMHLLGGFWVALVALWIISFLFSQLLSMSSAQVFIITILVVLVVGFLWEIFELYYEISIVTAPDFLTDTITDIIMNIIGTIIAFSYAYPKIKPTVPPTTTPV